MSYFNAEAFQREMQKLAEQKLVSLKFIMHDFALAAGDDFYEKNNRVVPAENWQRTVKRLRDKPPLEKR